MEDVTEEEFQAAVVEYREQQRRIERNEVWQDEIAPYMAELYNLYLLPYLAQHLD